MSEWLVTGTHDGEFNEIPPTGREIEMKTMGKLNIADGKIQKEWGYYCSIENEVRKPDKSFLYR